MITNKTAFYESDFEQDSDYRPLVTVGIDIEYKHVTDDPDAGNYITDVHVTKAYSDEGEIPVTDEIVTTTLNEWLNKGDF